MDNLDTVAIKITFVYDRVEHSITCTDLEQVAAAIDDFSSYFCEERILLVNLKGANKFVPCDFFVEEVRK